MAEIGYTLASKLIEVLASHSIQKICSIWNYETQLEQLKKTVFRIQKLFLDADACWEQLNEQQRGFIMELKDVVYDAEDVFDEFRTRAELNQLGKNIKSKVRMLFEKVRASPPFDKSHNHAYRLSRDVKDIMKRLEDIASDHSKFNLHLDNRPIVGRPKETCYYVDAHKIIGRDKDKEKIISVLLDPSFQNKFCFLFIVGMGGLGKTALAQLVLNDGKIREEFPDSSQRLWVCVSDHYKDQFDEKVILCKILESLTNDRQDYNSTKESVVKRFEEKIREKKKYVLVLDDVWNEDRDKWDCLGDFLRMGREGSKIIVTTRSEETTNIIDNKHVHKLDGLSQKDSQCLFEKSAFGEGEKNELFLEIGEKIVKKCHGNPLAIKVVGSLLYGQDISKWKSIERSGFTGISKDKIHDILKISYQNLKPSMKSCFSYCAVFTKGYTMDKEMLIDHWMAHGYIVPLEEGQNVEDVAEEHFTILMRRCFFQDIWKNRYGNIVSVKIHDLMHDIAHEVMKEEICVVNSKTSKLGEKIRHVNIIDNEAPNISSCSKIRTYIFSDNEYYVWDTLIENSRALRVLKLSFLSLKNLPQTINRLLLLRYLNLENNTNLEVLPNLITKLYNLQTLILRNCKNLREVPKDFSNLINLKHLDFYGCKKIKEMPLGILKLSNLQVLPYYFARNEVSNGELNVLKQVFNNLKGEIDIKSIYDDTERGDSKNMKPLVELWMSNYSRWPRWVNEDLLEKLKASPRLNELYFEGKWVINEDLLEKLEVPPHLNELYFECYKGKTIPLKGISLQPYLLHIVIRFCQNFEQIPVLSKLPHLKSLQLFALHSVEYMENERSSNNNDTKAVAEFFPSLELLRIQFMKKLKRWWKGEFPEMGLRFLRLTHLEILNCPNLTTNIVCPPTLEELKLESGSERLVITGELGKLREISIDKVDYLKLIPPTNKCLTSLELTGEIDVESALEHVACFASSLLNLTFSHCKKMRRLPRLDHLIALEKLELNGNKELMICEEEEEEEEESLKSFPQSLRHLVFDDLPKMKRMPKGMQHLTSLQSLTLYSLHNMEGGLPEWMSCLSSLQFLKIWKCEGIKTLPEAIKDLTSLKELHMYACPNLEERCKEPNGEDVLNIKHIPWIYINHKRISFSQQ